MTKFNIQDRIVLDEMVDTFTHEMRKTHKEYELLDKKTNYYTTILGITDKRSTIKK